MEKTVRITVSEPARLLVFVPTWWLLRLFLHRLSHAMEPLGPEARQFTAELHLRTGPIGAWLHRREFAAARRHMREEGENLKRLGEARYAADRDDAGGDVALPGSRDRAGAPPRRNRV
jgi:hypothetical protein